MSATPLTRVLIAGWSSFEHGEATAGDVLSMQTVTTRLERAGIAHDVAWSAVMRPPGGVLLEEADPADYSHLVFVCGPAHGLPVRQLHARFAGCHRTAVGVTVIDPADPAVTGFDVLLPRDGPGHGAQPDLAAHTHAPAVPVVGVFLAEGQGEYGPDRRHESVTAALTAWLGGLEAARLPLETRLDPRDWRLSETPAQSESVVRRLDAVVTTRLHGLVLALKNGVPALAVDPVAGGGKVTAQAGAWQWPAVTAAEDARAARLDEQLRWCLSAEGRRAAQERAHRRVDSRLADQLLQTLRPEPVRAVHR